MVYDYDGSSHKNISIGGDKRKVENFINDDAIERSRSSTDSDCVNINMNEFMAQRRKHAQEEYTQIRNELACKKWGPQTQKYFADNFNHNGSPNWKDFNLEQKRHFCPSGGSHPNLQMDGREVTESYLHSSNGSQTSTNTVDIDGVHMNNSVTDTIQMNETYMKDSARSGQQSSGRFMNYSATDGLQMNRRSINNFLRDDQDINGIPVNDSHAYGLSMNEGSMKNSFGHGTQMSMCSINTGYRNGGLMNERRFNTSCTEGAQFNISSMNASYQNSPEMYRLSINPSGNNAHQRNSCYRDDNNVNRRAINPGYTDSGNIHGFDVNAAQNLSARNKLSEKYLVDSVDMNRSGMNICHTVNNPWMRNEDKIIGSDTTGTQMKYSDRKEEDIKLMDYSGKKQEKVSHMTPEEMDGQQIIKEDLNQLEMNTQG